MTTANQPPRPVHCAVKDVTDKDIVLMNYRRLQAEHAVRQALKKEKK